VKISLLKLTYILPLSLFFRYQHFSLRKRSSAGVTPMTYSFSAKEFIDVKHCPVYFAKGNKTMVETEIMQTTMIFN